MKTTRSSTRRGAGLLIVLALLLALSGLMAAVGTRAQDATPAASSGGVVPAVPPWRAELVPRERPLVVTVGDTEVPVEVANNDRERSLGLGQRDGLLPGTGMLFVFDTEPEVRNFWMGGMRFCLDVVWVDDGEIIGAAQNTCPGPPGEGQDLIPRHQSPGVSEYVLEVPAGFLAENGYGVGTPITFSVDPYSIPVPAEDAG